MDNMDVLIDEFLQRLAHELKRKGHLTEIDGKFSQAELTAVSLPMGKRPSRPSQSPHPGIPDETKIYTAKSSKRTNASKRNH